MFNKQAEQIENTKVFCKTLKCFAKQNTKVFCHKALYCFAIRLTIVITSVRTLMQISNAKDDLHPHRPPPLPLSVPYWHRRHRWHGCRVVATIATVAIAAATATAATVSAATSNMSACFLVDCLPSRCFCYRRRCLPRRCRCWLPTQLSLLPRPQTHNSVLREQAQQINFNFKSVLNSQNTFKSVFNLLGLFAEYSFREKLFQPYIQKSFLVIGYYKKIWNRAKIFFLLRPQYCPPFFSQSSIFLT